MSIRRVSHYKEELEKYSSENYRERVVHENILSLLNCKRFDPILSCQNSDV